MASALDRWLATLSRGTIAVLTIGGGIIFIVLSDPPHTVCDSQMELLRQQQKGFLFEDPKDKKAKLLPSFASMLDYCEKGNGPGACYELFGKMRKVSQDIASVPTECGAKAGAIKEVKSALWGTVDFMVKAAWGTKPPAAAMEKFGWLDAADIALFCSLQTEIIRIYGQASWDSYRESLFHELPGAKDLPRKSAWEKLILSEPCNRYR